VAWLIDTNLCIDALRGRDGGARRWLRAQRASDVLLSAVVAFELWQGAWLAQEPATEQRRVEHFLAPFDIAPFDAAASAESGRIAADLRRRGTPIGAYDTLLAGHAIALGAAVATANFAHFERVPGLEVLHVRS